MRIDEFATLIPVGRENAIRSEDLARLVGVKGVRQLQDMIATARLQGCLICSGCGAGYWRPANREELRSLNSLLIQQKKCRCPTDRMYSNLGGR